MCAILQNQDLDSAVCDALFEASLVGARPLTEHSLAVRFGVSRTPIREVLSQLENEGAIERKQRKGIVLRRPSAKEIVELYELRAVLEAYAAGQAARRATREDLNYLTANAEQFAQCRKRGDFQGCERINILFHDKIIAMAGNDLLQGMVTRFNIIRKAFRITRGLVWDDREFNTSHPHLDLVKLIRNGKTDACEVFMRAHILRAKDILLQKALGLTVPLRDERRTDQSDPPGSTCNPLTHKESP